MKTKNSPGSQSLLYACLCFLSSSVIPVLYLSHFSRVFHYSNLIQDFLLLFRYVKPLRFQPYLQLFEPYVSPVSVRFFQLWGYFLSKDQYQRIFLGMSLRYSWGYVCFVFVSSSRRLNSKNDFGCVSRSWSGTYCYRSKMCHDFV